MVQYIHFRILKVPLKKQVIRFNQLFWMMNIDELYPWGGILNINYVHQSALDMFHLNRQVKLSININHLVRTKINTGWWFQPLSNILVNGKDDIPYIMENKKCSKPPTRTSSTMKHQLYPSVRSSFSKQLNELPPADSKRWRPGPNREGPLLAWMG